MELLQTGRQNGKTFRSVEWVLKGQAQNKFPFWTRVLLVMNHAERERIIKKYHLSPRQVFVFDDWANTGAGVDKTVTVAIDNADVILQNMVRGHRIALITMTMEDRL